MTTAAENVAKGAVFLDENYVGWYNRINTDILYMGSVHYCILGQLYGNFHDGVSILFFSANGISEDDRRKARYGAAVNYGFEIEFDIEDDPYVEMTNLWRNEIKSRIIA